jgi:hypothetical protein
MIERQHSPACRPEFWFVADADPVVALPFFLSAETKQNSDRRRDDARRDRSFVNGKSSVRYGSS